MAKYYLTNKAVKDLSGIWDYTFDHWSEEQADIYYHGMLDSCTKIAMHPEIGREFDGIAPDLLGYRTQRHIIFYRTGLPNGIEITRILHEKIDLKRRLF